MSWLLLTMSSIILWGITDILLRKSLDRSDPLSQFKTLIWLGLVMAPAGIVMAFVSDTLPLSIRLLSDNLYLIPLCALYVAAMFFGLLGAKHLDASVVSPLENVDGAIAAIILYFFFLLTNRSHVIADIGVMDMISAAAITVGVTFLGIQEQKLSRQEIALGEEKKQHRLGALALLFPLAYNLVDAFSIVAMAITVSGETEASIPDIDFFFFECLAFSLTALIVWLYMLIAKKYKYNPFKKTESSRLGAAACESMGTMMFTFAVGIDPILTAPVSSSYCFVTIILARIFLKERLTKKQYLSLLLVVVGIALLGLSEIIKALK